ncbi:MAG: response regulator [Anaerolineae bacterium]|nr:MAG: response regulator [Anaerolineae bacterium]
METILLVEDDVEMCAMTREMLEFDGYRVVTAVDGRDALEKLEQVQPDLIISDIAMPEMDGYELLKAVRARPEGALLPFLFLSARTTREDVRQARRLGVDDFLFKPFDMRELREAVRIRLDRRKLALMVDTREAHLQTVLMLANAIEIRDPYTRGHVERVRRLALAFGRALGLDEGSMLALEFGAILHDVGKIIIPKEILVKPGSLTEEEKAIMQQHVLAGANMLKGITHLKAALPYVLYHHERWDGTGYPHGLAGESIPFEGRLLAIVDAYDALISDRSYRPGRPIEQALLEIERSISTYFDPYLADVFLEMMRTSPPSPGMWGDETSDAAAVSDSLKRG